MYRKGSNGFITEKTILFGSRGGGGGGGGGPNTHFYRTPYNLWFSEGGPDRTPCPPMDLHKHTEAVILIETGVWICGQTDKTDKHAHLQTGRLKETSMRKFLTDRQAVGETEKYIRVKYDNELKFDWWKTMQFHCIGHYVRLIKMCYETVGIIIDLLWPLWHS